MNDMWQVHRFRERTAPIVRIVARIGLGVILFALLLWQTAPTAHADNCGSFSDCFDTISTALFVFLGVILLAAVLLFVLPELLGIGALAGEAIEAGVFEGAAEFGAEFAAEAEAEAIAADAEAVAVDAEAEAAAEVEAEAGDLFAKSPGEAAADLSAETYGPANVNNAAEYEQIMTDLENSGVRVNLTDDVPLGQGAYGPGSPGEPGTFTVNPNTDISTLGHEYEHFLMDRELEYPGLRGYMQNPDLMVQGEIRAYNTEIARALEGGHGELAEALEQAKQETIAGILSRLAP